MRPDMQPPHAGQRGAITSVQVDAENTTEFTATGHPCPLACGGSRCPWRCPVLVADAVHELVAELPAVAR